MSRSARPRLVVLDDGLFFRSDAAILSVAATFHRFVEAVATSPDLGEVRYLVPVLERAPAGSDDASGEGIDQSRLTVVPTAPFAGSADYVRRWPLMTARNWGVVEAALADADLLWLRLPASNAALAMAAARRHGVPWFSWIAGSAREVVAGQHRAGFEGWLAGLAASGYDAVTELAVRTGPHILLGHELFASVVSDADIEATRAAAREAPSETLRIAWLGRMAREKGLDDLVAAMALVEESGTAVRLTLIGDGPDRPRIEGLAGSLAVPVTFSGYVRDHATVMTMLRDADVFVNPSRSEGVPKTVIEAMAAGTPVVATDVGAVRDLIGASERGRLVPAGAPAQLARAIVAASQDGRNSARAGLALEWAADHTVDAQARRLVNWMRNRFSDLPWPQERT